MFLDVTVRRNPGLISTAVRLHREGRLPSNCYVIDLDKVRRNGHLLKERARELGLRWYFMSKQIGRDPMVLSAVVDPGSKQVVAVDVQEAQQIHRHGIGLGHVGHLSQIPSSEVRSVLEMEPEVVTVFGRPQARALSQALGPGQEQQVLLRVWSEGDFFFHRHRGGIPEEDIASAAKAIGGMPGLRIAGLTSFPCLSYDGPGRPQVTPNLATLLRSAERLRAAGVDVQQLNAPGNTSVETMELLASAGATHVEPGHALTGTTIWHAFEDLTEFPSMIYLTEVSHLHSGRAFVLGGGFYLDQVTPSGMPTPCLIGADPGAVFDRRGWLEVDSSSGGIDYYGIVRPEDGKAEVGDSVVFAFRAQVFATRAYVAVLTGADSEEPRVLSVLDRGHQPVPGFSVEHWRDG